MRNEIDLGNKKVQRKIVLCLSKMNDVCVCDSRDVGASVNNLYSLW